MTPPILLAVTQQPILTLSTINRTTLSTQQMRAAIEATRLLLMVSWALLIGSTVIVMGLVKQEHGCWNGSQFLRHRRSLELSQGGNHFTPPMEQRDDALLITERSENDTPQGLYATSQALFQASIYTEGEENQPHNVNSAQKQTSVHTNTGSQPWGNERMVQRNQQYIPPQKTNDAEVSKQPDSDSSNVGVVNQLGQPTRHEIPASVHMAQSQQVSQQMQTLSLPNQSYSQFPTLSTPKELSQSQSTSSQLQTQILVQREAQSLQLNQKSNDAQLGVSVPEQNPDCVVPDAAEKSVRHPVWTASYPGSGAKLTWKLIRAITGIFTSDDHDHNGRVEKGTIVAVKTHFPSHTHPHIFHQEKLKHIGRVVLLTRNPINSIPSYHNFVFEQQNGLLNHSTRAPVDVWIKWRNLFYQQELQAWVDHQRYWLDNYSAGVFHLVAMEHLTSAEKGPDTLQMLGHFLANGEPDIAETMVPPERMGCIWDMFVNGKVPGERERRHSHRSGGPTVYPFTQLQLDQMISALETLKNQYPNCRELTTVLDEYILNIQETKQGIDLL